MSNIIRMVLLLVLSQGALAKTLKTTARDCSLLLSPQAPALDYALSDLEGSFLELIKKVQNANEVPAARTEYFIKDVLNMKASVLNQVTDLLPMVLVSTGEGPKRARVLSSIYQILDSLGVPPKLFGLNVNEQGQILVPEVPEKVRQLAHRRPAEVHNNPIGFVIPARGEPGGEVPEGMHRSIGFGPHILEDNPAPARQLGFIQRSVSPENKMIMIVVDREKNAQYSVDLRILTSAGGRTDSRTYQLEFNQEIREWIVKIENLNNPTGHIGFL